MLALPPSHPATPATTHVYAQAPVVITSPTVVQRVSLAPTLSRSDLVTDPANWGWAELRDYVIAEMFDRFGPSPRDQRKEYGIFSRFLNEYGPDAVAIARYAFGPACNGWWGNAPISVNRFCKASDVYFSQPILERLRQTG